MLEQLVNYLFQYAWVFSICYCIIGLFLIIKKWRPKDEVHIAENDKPKLPKEGKGDSSLPWPDYSVLTGVQWPKPHADFILEKTLPRPYRPLRWPYHQTMAHNSLEPDWWLEVESTYKERIAQRKRLYELHRKKILNWLPGEDVEIACRETMELALIWLTKRYPQLFELRDDFNSHIPTVGVKTTKKIFVNHILETKTYVDDGNIHPLIVLLENIPEDFAIMLPTSSANLSPSSAASSSAHKITAYTLRAGVICSAVGWNLGTKIGLSLYDIHHTTGFPMPVPHYKTNLSFSLDKYFSNSIPMNKPVQRGSWSLEVGQPLFVLPGDQKHTNVDKQDPEIKIENVHFRVDWQTLRRLPRSRAVLFNFRALFYPIESFRYEPKIPSIMLKILCEGDKEILKYKGTWHVEHVVIPFLRECVAKQEKKGKLGLWEVATLREYPFFEGWEQSWKEQN